MERESGVLSDFSCNGVGLFSDLRAWVRLLVFSVAILCHYDSG